MFESELRSLHLTNHSIVVKNVYLHVEIKRPAASVSEASEAIQLGRILLPLLPSSMGQVQQQQQSATAATTDYYFSATSNGAKLSPPIRLDYVPQPPPPAPRK